MRSVNPSGQAAMPSLTNYAPSVPISLYREVAAELQATKAAMESLKTQNQQLAKQNQQLRQEIEKAVQSALNLRHTANGMPMINPDAPPAPSMRLDLVPELEAKFQIPVMPAHPPVSDPKFESAAIPREDLIIEEDSKPRRKIKLEKEASPELGGWWLGVVIALIVVTAFGAGFLIVRPLLPLSK